MVNQKPSELSFILPFYNDFLGIQALFLHCVLLFRCFRIRVDIHIILCYILLDTGYDEDNNRP